MFIKAVRSVTLDNGFDLATEKAQRARLTAHRLLKYCEANEKVTGEFAKKLLNFVRACCSHPRPVTCHTFKERMWEKFYKLCAKEEFNTMWKTFIQSSIGFNGSPIFYQFVTRAILEEQVKIQFPTEVPLQPGASYTVTSLDFEDSSALRYCGGYIIRSLKKKIGKSAHPLRDALLLCLNDLIEEGKIMCVNIIILIPF